MGLASTPKPPYYAVIFTSKRASAEDGGYAATAERMDALAKAQRGYLGIESARGPDGFGITVSYWTDVEAVAAWKAVAEHEAAQRMGRDRWYEEYDVRVCRVERAYGFRK
jgi:heme-degrading monooxygenase HmoA